MPYITIQMLEGRSLDQKRELAQVLTRETARICQVDPSLVHLIIHELPHTNIAKVGKLVSDS